MPKKEEGMPLPIATALLIFAFLVGIKLFGTSEQINWLISNQTTVIIIGVVLLLVALFVEAIRYA